MGKPKSWIIGGDPRCDIVVDQPIVSGRHCELSRTEAGFVLRDLQSRNGTSVNGVRIESPTRVSRSDTITLGRSVPLPWPAGLDAGPGAMIRIGRLPENDVVLDYPMVSGFHPRILSAEDGFWIEDLGSTNGTAIESLGNKVSRAKLGAGDAVFFGSLRVAASRLVSDHFSLGYQPCTAVPVQQREIILGRDATWDLVLDDPRVSRRHARLVKSDQAISVEDLGSTNGTFVNGRRIKRKTTVKPGDVITVGSHTFTVTASGDLQQRDWRGNVAIEACELTVDVQTRRLIDGISLTIYPAEFVGLMGPSGAGKTTLMMALNGYTVPSGGQRKRVNLAMELLTDPSVLFLDEPTSGLSSKDALMVMRLLRRLADQGKTILLTIHQPSLEAYRQLDNLILVGRDHGSSDPGRLVYYGPAYPQAVEFRTGSGVVFGQRSWRTTDEQADHYLSYGRPGLRRLSGGCRLVGA